MLAFLCVCLCLSLAKAAGQGEQVSQEDYFTVYWEDGQYVMRSGRDPLHGAAFGRFVDAIPQNGWAQLWVNGGKNMSLPDTARAHAAGFLEGALSHKRIWTYFVALKQVAALWVWPNDPDGRIEAAVKAWVNQQQRWTQQQIQTNAASSAYWTHIELISEQLQGIAEGYNSVASPSQVLSLEDFLLINSFPDILDIANVVAPHSRVDWLNLPKQQVMDLFAQRTHCSAFVKVVPSSRSEISLNLNENGNQNTKTANQLQVFSGHTTWIAYSMMTRIFKHFDLEFFHIKDKEEGHANLHLNLNSKISFSSYPGQIVSADDYYVIGQNEMVVMETSNSIFNNKLYQLVVPQSLLSWQRTCVANRVAKGGADWAHIFKQFNSGTYNNQWIIVDYKKLNGSKLGSDFLWIVEQIPGFVDAADETPWIDRHQYWASYNIPYFEKIFIASGYADMEKKFGNVFSWVHCPRSQIFKRNSSLVLDMPSMQSLLRYNNYLHDPLSDKNPTFAISARGDLGNTNSSSPFGGIDTKVNSNRLSPTASTIAQSGPTHDQLPPFQWTQKWAAWPHLGQPTHWDFGWVVMRSA
jgi:hypothetical protein